LRANEDRLRDLLVLEFAGATAFVFL
jgi:hypothetical protein